MYYVKDQRKKLQKVKKKEKLFKELEEQKKQLKKEKDKGEFVKVKKNVKNDVVKVKKNNKDVEELTLNKLRSTTLVVLTGVSSLSASNVVPLCNFL
jgi:hypothetical protein